MSWSVVFRVVCSMASAWLLAFPMLACRGKDHVSTAAPPPGLAAGTSAPVQAGEPAIEFDMRMHDFGLVNEGTALKHVFRVRNGGTAPLVLSEVRTSCGCTAATLGITTLPPGGSGPLEVTMDTHGVHGKGKRSITVSANDPRQPTSTLEIAYEVERLLGLDRTFVHLATTQGTNRVEKVWLAGKLVRQARLRVHVEGTTLVTARAIEARAAGQRRKGLQLELHGQNRASGDGVVTIKTGLANPSELSLAFAYAVN